MSESKKPTVSEMRKLQAVYKARDRGYLLDLVERMGEALGRCDQAIETAIYCEDGLDGAEGERVIKEARALLEELKL